MKITYDKDADAAYIYLVDKILKGAVERTIELNGDILLDFNKDKKLIGVEILHASKNMPKQAISKMIKVAA